MLPNTFHWVPTRYGFVRVQKVKPPGGAPIWKGQVSLRSVNFGFRSHLGCSGQNAIIFSRNVSFRVATKKYKKKLYIFKSFYLLDSFNQSLKWPLLRVKKRLVSTPRLVSFRGLIQNFRRAPRPFHMGVPQELNHLTWLHRSDILKHLRLCVCHGLDGLVWI